MRQIQAYCVANTILERTQNKKQHSRHYKNYSLMLTKIGNKTGFYTLSMIYPYGTTLTISNEINKTN